ncbi:MAG: serine/threonine-protein kinase [Gemmatimonas sp.]
MSLEDLRRRLSGRYEIERELGRGGMGAVYLARDIRLGRLVALKILPSEYAMLPALRERFLRETRMAASFSHPNIVPVYAIEESDDLLGYVMGYVEGESLAERVKRAGPLSIRETVRLLQDVGYALAYAHGRSVVHRDMKPDNVMIERATGRALVMDFGVARAISAPGPAEAEGLTRVGEVVGTPEYMSPEQATGDHVDGRSDLYSLGLTAYFAVTGRVAMAAESTSKALAKQITEVLPPMRTVRPDLPAALADSIDRCVMKEPDARFANAEALVDAIDAAQLTTPEIPVPIRMFAQEAGAVSMVLLGGVILGFFILQSADENAGELDRALPIVLLLSALLTRVMQTFGEARRLAVDGFSADGVHRGLVAVVAERQARRAELHADPTTRRRRRRAFAVGIGGAALAYLMLRFAQQFLRTPLGPRSYHVSLSGIIMIFAAAIVFGVSTAVIVRSPFRMPLGEGLFRIVWIGPLGRAFVRLAGVGLARVTTPSTSSLAAVPRAPDVRPPASMPVAASDGRVDQLEARVAELERWRKQG